MSHESIDLLNYTKSKNIMNNPGTPVKVNSEGPSARFLRL